MAELRASLTGSWQVQEIQALKIGEDLLVSSNFDHEMHPLIAALPNGTKRGEIGAKLDAMVAAIDADKHKDAPKFVQAGSVDVLKEKFGRRKPGTVAVTVLRDANVTRNRLGNNQLSGFKVPCKVCLEVLKDFRRWYETEHKKNFVFTEGSDKDRHQTTSPPIDKYDFRTDAVGN